MEISSPAINLCKCCGFNYRYENTNFCYPCSRIIEYNCCVCCGHKCDYVEGNGNKFICGTCKLLGKNTVPKCTKCDKTPAFPNENLCMYHIETKTE